MKRNRRVRKGVRFIVTRGMIREYLKLQPLERLAWLQEGAVMSYHGLTRARRVIWEKFRKGDL